MRLSNWFGGSVRKSPKKCSQTTFLHLPTVAVLLHSFGSEVECCWLLLSSMVSIIINNKKGVNPPTQWRDSSSSSSSRRNNKHETLKTTISKRILVYGYVFIFWDRLALVFLSYSLFYTLVVMYSLFRRETTSITTINHSFYFVLLVPLSSRPMSDEGTSQHRG